MMIKLYIQWFHLEVNGETCDRCNETYTNLLKSIRYVKEQHKGKNIKVFLKDVKLSEDNIKYSNLIVINGLPIHRIIDIQEVQNYCKSCSDMVGKEIDCRGIKYRGKLYNSIPVVAIVSAINRSLYFQSKKMRV